MGRLKHTVWQECMHSGGSCALMGAATLHPHVIGVCQLVQVLAHDLTDEPIHALTDEPMPQVGEETLDGSRDFFMVMGVALVVPEPVERVEFFVLDKRFVFPKERASPDLPMRGRCGKARAPGLARGAAP